MPEYRLNFGCTKAGTVEQRIVRASNASRCPLSFSIDQTDAIKCGFTVLPAVVDQLPENGSVDLVITLDRKTAVCECGTVDTMLHIIVSGIYFVFSLLMMTC